MGSSFTGYRGHGFWARDGILETWLAALADVVPADATGWLAVAARRWRGRAWVEFEVGGQRRGEQQFGVGDRKVMAHPDRDMHSIDGWLVSDDHVLVHGHTIRGCPLARCAGPRHAG